MSTATGQFRVEGKNLGETIETIQRWARHAFPDQTLPRVIEHLYNEEHDEFLDAIDRYLAAPDDPSEVASELADQIMLLVVAADLAGIDVLTALQEKHEKNLAARTEYRPDLGYDKMVRE